MSWWDQDRFDQKRQFPLDRATCGEDLANTPALVRAETHTGRPVGQRSDAGLFAGNATSVTRGRRAWWERTFRNDTLAVKRAVLVSEGIEPAIDQKRIDGIVHGRRSRTVLI